MSNIGINHSVTVERKKREKLITFSTAKYSRKTLMHFSQWVKQWMIRWYRGFNKFMEIFISDLWFISKFYVTRLISSSWTHSNATFASRHWHSFWFLPGDYQQSLHSSSFFLFFMYLLLLMMKSCTFVFDDYRRLCPIDSITRHVSNKR